MSTPRDDREATPHLGQMARQAHEIGHPTPATPTPSETPATVLAEDYEAVCKRLFQAERELAAAQSALAEANKKQPINTHVRLFDLVRNCRAELHEQDLITDDEYAWLCQHTFPTDAKQGSPSPRRLEDYDALRSALRELEADKGRLEMAYKLEPSLKDRIPAWMEHAARDQEGTPQ